MGALTQHTDVIPPNWLKCFASLVSKCLRPTDVMAPIGCHYYHNHARDEWEVTLFVSRTQVVGGPLDGRAVISRFDVDLDELRMIFDTPPALRWQALRKGEADELGPHISSEGSFRDQLIWLRIVAAPPNRFDAGRVAHAYELKLEDTW